jgi:serine phosphatase RsbU (regulator of sigma subunit)/putative methionine-R-sulfoxide reductase with GAF domain
LDWREIASLGEQLANASSLTAQRDRIVSMTGRMLRGKVEVWLQEKLFRLPDRTAPRLFPPQPRSDGMRRALARRTATVRRAFKQAGSKKAVAAVPIEDQGFLLGALQITRSNGPNFEKAEVELLASIASVVAVGLYAAHRVEVERFRLGELNLVSQVSAEIANVLNLDELARRVTQLIQKTFNYYYVAIFTLKAGAGRLRFRSSAGSARTGRKKQPLTLEVEVGEGLIGEAAATGELIAAADVRADARYRFIEHLPETCSEVAIPLKLGNRVLGVLDVQSDRLNAFHPNDLLVLRALADNVARAVEGARLYSDVRRRAEQLALVADVSRSVTSTLELDQMMVEAATLIHDRFGFPHVSLYTVHPNRRLIEYEAGSGKRSPALRGYSIPLDEPRGMIPWVAREAQTILANDVNHEPRYRASPLPPKNTRSELTVPLVYGERVLGVLDIQSQKLNAFTEDDQLMFEAVAGTIAASIRNADLYRSEQWRRQVTDSLREVAGLLSEHIGVDEALEAILTELERNLPVDISVIWLLDRGVPYVAAVHGAQTETIEHVGLASPEAAAVLAALMRSEQPVVRQASDPMWPSGQAGGFSRNYSSLAAPLRVNEQPVGVIALAHHEPGRYGHEARAMTATFASYAAVAIENARLYDAAQERADTSAALLQVAQAISAPGDLNAALDATMRMLPSLAGMARSALYGWDATRRMYLPLAEFGLGEIAKKAMWEREIGEGKFPLLDAARTAGEDRVHVLLSKDVPENWISLDAEKPTEQALIDAGRLLLVVPLIIKTDLLGLLLVEEAAGPRRPRGRRLEIIHGISQQVAVALQNELLRSEMFVRERLETEVHLARQIQQGLMPESLPQYDGWELAARWETARQVGGDFYDVIELPRGRIGVFIADVADKGMPAALFMALTRTLFRAATEGVATPAQALQRVNNLLIPDTHQGMFVTAVYAILDRVTGEFTYANAGHNPPLWIRSEGVPEKLTRTGMALGVIDGASITDRTICLGSGESVLLYTDGLTEAFSPDGRLFGEDRLLGTVCREKSSSAHGLLRAIESELNDFLDSLPLSDDLTMLVIRRT